MEQKRITFAVTNDLVYDQRMQKICTSLQNTGYRVTLVGRMSKDSLPLVGEAFMQHRLSSWFSKGKLMYFEFNLRLLFFLLFNRADVYCAIDLDTIIPVFIVSKIKNSKRVYDAHELFTEQKEIVTRPAIQRIWLKVEKFAIPKFKHGYTVNQFIADEFRRRYNVDYPVVKNLPTLKTIDDYSTSEAPFIIYQGAVNEGRSFETLIPAMKEVDGKLIICGNGNYFEQVKKLIRKHKVFNKVELRGYVVPKELSRLTPGAHVAVTLFEKVGLNQYNSLSNRFFDYIMAGVPQVCVGYPEYEAINDKYGIAYLIYNTDAGTIAQALNNLLNDSVLHNSIKQNCLKAREELNWSTEEKILIRFYNRLTGTGLPN